MRDLIAIKKRSPQERLIIAKTLIESVLEDLPSAQPKIVMCKDCKNWDTTWQNDWAKNYHYCPLIDETRNGDWYCADAERRPT